MGHDCRWRFLDAYASGRDVRLESAPRRGTLYGFRAQSPEERQTARATLSSSGRYRTAAVSSQLTAGRAWPEFWNSPLVAAEAKTPQFSRLFGDLFDEMAIPERSGRKVGAATNCRPNVNEPTIGDAAAPHEYINGGL